LKDPLNTHPTHFAHHSQQRQHAGGIRRHKSSALDDAQGPRRVRSVYVGSSTCPRTPNTRPRQHAWRLHKHQTSLARGQ